MKRKQWILPIALFMVMPLNSCGLFEGLFETDTDTNHVTSYDKITGKFVLYEAADERYTYKDTYFQFDGSKNQFNMKYYENGKLKHQGEFQKIVTYEDRVGYWCNNLHLNVKVGNEWHHISTYTEDFENLNQFRILEEYNHKNELYYLSELPYVMGTYVRENEKYVEEKPNKNKVDYMTPTLSDFTSALDGKFQLDEDHYFYFVNPKGYPIPDGSCYESYFQYHSKELSKPIEGFALGFTSKDSETSRINFRTRKETVDWGEGSEGRIDFGYDTFDEKGNMISHPGSIDFSDGELHSFTFEHLSRRWTDKEWKDYLDNDMPLPDAILYDFIGGTYEKV